jgi:DNA-directed RNA polymerase
MKERVIELTKQGLSKEQIFEVLKSENKVVLAKAADKLTLPQRSRYVRQSLATLKAQAENPVQNKEWTGADQPIQYMKAIKDYTKAQHSISQGKEYKSSVSVDLDATCSGIQVYGMMFLDVAASHGVNVSPSDCVQDIYGTIATEMCKIIERISTGDIPSKIKEWLNKEEEKEGRDRTAKLLAIAELGKSFINRSHTKRIVMTLTYGLTNFGIMEYSQEAVEKIGENKFTNANLAKLAFAKVVSVALGKAADCAVRGMEFTQKIAKYCASNQIGMEWTTPCGFKAFRATEAVEESSIQLKVTKREFIEDVNGVKHSKNVSALDKLYVYTKTGELSSKKMESAVAPDLVHSLDASWLMMAVKKAHDKGISKFKLVHDSFGTTAANIPKLNIAIREAAVEMSQGNYFKEWAIEVTKSQDWEECKSKVNDWKGEEYISDADVEQGTLDLDTVMNSDHIFS